MQLIVQFDSFIQVFIGILGPGAGKVDHDQANGGTHASLFNRADCFFRKEVHIIKAGYASPQHFCASQQAAVMDKLRADPFLFRWPDVVM